MPELPEVHTTATILDQLIVGKQICDVWSNYDSSFYLGKNNIKDRAYFSFFKKKVQGKKILRVWRRGKNVLIDIEGEHTIVIHMKMTGHLLHGTYSYNKKKNEWRAQDNGPLQDPFNGFIRLVFSFSDGTHLAFSDMRKFASVHLVPDKESLRANFDHLGPEPLDKSFTNKVLKDRLSKRPNQKIKTALMNQELVAGIGNIYSDEILWSSFVHPERTVQTISDSEFKTIHTNCKKMLSRGIDFGGDSMSDYRNPYGVPGDFQNHHNVYQRKNQKCNRRGCPGIIERKVINGRSAHFCPECQK